MVLHFHREPLVVRIERGSFCNRPGFEDAVIFEPEIVMQPAGIVFLNDEAPALRWRDRQFAARLGGLFEIAFLPINRQLVVGHGDSCALTSRATLGPGTKTLTCG